MLYRRFGRTNLQMPVLSCGGMRYQFKWNDVPLGEVPPDSQANLEACIRRSVELGINHIETARGYGSSERQLGLILPKFPREKLIVQTKVGPEADPAVFTKNFEESLERLQLSHVELLAIHGINNHETLHQAIRPNGCLAAARAIQKRGLAKHIGFSTHGSSETIMQAITHNQDGGFDYVNLHWYYIYQNNWKCIKEATRRDMGVFIISPSDKGGMLYAPPAKLVELCEPVHPIIFNDVFCLSHPEVHTLSIGAARPGDFDLHVQAIEQLPRAGSILPGILERLQKAYDGAIPEKLRQPFAMELPEWEATPGHINIQVILWLLNLAKAYDMRAYGKMRYNLLGNGGHWFPGLTAEKAGSVDLSAVAAVSKLGAELQLLLAEAHQMLAAEAVQRLSKSE